MRKLTTEEFIVRAKKTHGSDYDYSKSVYVNSRTKILIICNACREEFWQGAEMHTERGNGCNKCNRKRVQSVKGFKNFVEKSNALHGVGRYDYSIAEIEYVTQRDKVTIACNVCGHVFKQLPNNHMYSGGPSRTPDGCPKCAEERTQSLGAQEVQLTLENLQIDFEKEKTFPDLINPKTGWKLRLDFWVSKENTAIEFDGEQHFTDLGLFGDLKETQDRDAIKDEWALKNNIQLTRISFEDHKKGFIASIISALFG